MTREFGKSKYVKKYLENRYGEIYNLTFDEQADLRKSIVMDHDLTDIERMLRRTKSSIEGAKDSQPIYKRNYLKDILEECKDEYEELKKQNKQDESSSTQ